jgi:hypothetical protein
MPATYEPIATTTLGSAQSSVTFSSISGSYTDLVLVTSMKAASGYGSFGFLMQLNSDTGSNYSYTYLLGNGSSASSGRASNTTKAIIGTTSDANFGTIITQINNYSNTTTYKTMLSRDNATDVRTGAWVSLWRSTSAITSILVKVDDAASNLILSGSTFTLYGIKAA